MLFCFVEVLEALDPADAILFDTSTSFSFVEAFDPAGAFMSCSPPSYKLSSFFR